MGDLEALSLGAGYIETPLTGGRLKDFIRLDTIKMEGRR
jgi:hypothetical protein